MENSNVLSQKSGKSDCQTRVRQTIDISIFFCSSYTCLINFVGGPHSILCSKRIFFLVICCSAGIIPVSAYNPYPGVFSGSFKSLFIVCPTRVWQSLFPLFCDKTFEFAIQTWQTSLEHYYMYVYVQTYFLSQLRKMLILLTSFYGKMCTLPTLRSRVFVCCKQYKHARSYCWQWTHFTIGPNEQNQHFAELRQKICLHIYVVVLLTCLPSLDGKLER